MKKSLNLLYVLFCILLTNSALAQNTQIAPTDSVKNTIKKTSSEEVSEVVYKDEKGNIISAADYIKKKKNYSSAMKMQGNDVIHYLISKKGADKQQHQIQEATNEPLDKLLGSKLLDFEFTTIDGKKITTELLAGKVIVLNFWFIACKPCIAEIPELNSLVEKYKSNPNIVFLAFARDNKEPLKKFLENVKFAYQIVPSTISYGNELGIYAYPTQIVVNKDGIIKYILTGGAATDAKMLLTDAIDKALN